MHYEEFVLADTKRLYDAVFKRLEHRFFPFELSDNDAKRIAHSVSEHYRALLVDHFGIPDADSEKESE